MGTSAKTALVAAAAALAAATGGACGTKRAAVNNTEVHVDAGTTADSARPRDAAPPPMDATANTAPTNCPDLFAQDTLRSYSIDISATEWNSMVAEFNNTAALLTGVSFTVYHPIVFHLDGETVTDAAIKLHGQSSWLQTVMFDGAKAKMQFQVSFNETNPNGNFHGLTKLVFDMPRADWTFLHDRLAHMWLREVGIMAPCSTSARLDINGKYYGLYVLEQNVGDHLIKTYFPDNPDGDLWKGGREPETNKASPNWSRKTAFWNATTLSAITNIVDLPGSLPSWAAEAILNNSDGYYGGNHNFLIYDQGAKGFIFIPQDTDSTFEYLSLFDRVGYQDHPVFWWEDRVYPPPEADPHWVTVLSDPSWRTKYADAIAALLSRWDVTEMTGHLDTWSQQIAGAVADDPHRWASTGNFQQAITAAREVIAKRPGYLQTFVDCVHNNGPDNDGDGYAWCADCSDKDPSIHPGAHERCGNHLDDNCDGFVDEGCGPPPDAGVVPNPTPVDGGAPTTMPPTMPPTTGGSDAGAPTTPPTTMPPPTTGGADAGAPTTPPTTVPDAGPSERRP